MERNDGGRNERNDLGVRNESKRFNDLGAFSDVREKNEITPVNKREERDGATRGASGNAGALSVAVAKTVTTVAAVVGAVIIGVAEIDVLDVFRGDDPGYKIEIFAGRDYVSYVIFNEKEQPLPSDGDGTDYYEYEEPSYDEPAMKTLTVTVFNDFTRRVSTVEFYGEASGYEEGLKENMSYTIEVSDGDRVVLTGKFRTEPSYYIDAYPSGDGIAFILIEEGRGDGEEDDSVYSVTVTGGGETFRVETTLLKQESLQGLKPGTKYTLEVRKGNKVVATNTVATEIYEPESEPESGSESETGGEDAPEISYGLEVVPEADLASFSFYKTVDGKYVDEEDFGYRFEVTGADGAIVFSGETSPGSDGEVTGLEPLTQYVMTVYYGDEAVAEEGFTTEKRSEPQIDYRVEVTPYSESAFFRFYKEIDGVADDEEDYGYNFVVTDPDGEEVYGGEMTPGDGIEIPELNPLTQYVLTVYYEDAKILEETFTTTEDPTALKLTVTPDIYAATVKIYSEDPSPYYDDTGAPATFTVSVSDGTAGTAGEETEVLYGEETMIDKLMSDTEYTLTVYDGNGNAILEQTFKTAAPGESA